MNNNQHDTIQQLINYVSKDESVLALILCGSIARGTETDRSDIDVIVVVTDARFNRERTCKNYFWGTDFDSKDFKVEVDGKIIPKEFLEKVWKDGNESIKSTLYHSKVLYSRDSDIDRLLLDKPNILIGEKSENIRKFYSLMKSSRFSAGDDLENTFYLNKCIYDTAFYACRLVLAHNNILYPCVKNMYKELENCKDIPKDFILLLNEVMHTYSYKKMVEFYNYVNNYFIEYHFDNRLRRGYVLENELFWFFNTVPYAEI
ncbi:nucleotidyltransferase domain-containing protein [Vallitalea pronyensis]|uniref:Nucleotidyltransferase domain-containing protein n=1 Tax=Vallitalea pronyensis TaxID=1348613 RepID=A0A8J8SHT6_9FIRM|nr:nucleotidyltransferase domain-containing protein [Vallitalea pronyensis]QUI24205.1 nucleotidyltransferase domain-containing protein [Vallitalea pronyensis]